jgi:hypothetical protein
VNKYNIFADSLYFEIKIRRQGPKTAGYRRKPAAISNPDTYTIKNTSDVSSEGLSLFNKREMMLIYTLYSIQFTNCI